MEKTDDSRQLGTYVQRKRTEAGLGVRQLGRLAGVDATWVMRLERGEYATPDPRHLAKLARALDIEVAELYLEAGYQPGDGLPGLQPYLRAKYDYLPNEAIDQLAAHFELINEKYRAEEGGRDARNHL